MNIGRRLALSLFIFGVAPVIAGGAATQYVGSLYQHHPALGPTLIAGLYAPWNIGIWLWRYQPNPPEPIQQAWVAALAGYGILVAAGALLSTLGGRRPKPYEDIQGSARWATPADAGLATLLSAKVDDSGRPVPAIVLAGFRIGKKLRYLMHSGPEHAIVVAPTRTGKGVSIVLPTLVSWSGSIVVHDMKGELFALSAGWRGQYAKNRIIRFDPAAPCSESHSFNPLNELSIGTPSEVAEAQNIAISIVDPHGKGLDDHWTKTSYALLTGLLLFCMYEKRTGPDSQTHTATLYDVRLAMADSKRTPRQLYQAMVDNTFGPDGTAHLTITTGGQAMLNTEERERSSILSTAVSFFSLYDDPLIQANTSRSDFRISDLMHAGEPMTLYLIVNPANKERLQPLMRLMITMMLRRLVATKLEFDDGQPIRNYRHRLLFLLDEFAELGKLKVVKDSLPYMAGWGISALICVQSLDQVEETFGKQDSTKSMCHYTVAFAPNDKNTGDWISSLLGMSTRVKEAITESGSRNGLTLDKVSRSFQEVSRALMTSDEVRQLRAAKKDKNGFITKAGAVVISIAGSPPVFGEQSLYFLDPIWKARVAVKPAQLEGVRPQPLEVQERPEPSIAHVTTPPVAAYQPPSVANIKIQGAVSEAPAQADRGLAAMLALKRPTPPTTDEVI